MRFLFSLMALATLITTAQADALYFRDGNRLYEGCTPSDRGTLNYILGVVDTHSLLEAQKVTKGLRFCLPDRVKAGQIVDVVCKDLRDNPATRHQGAAGLVAVALSEAFPCK